MPDCGGQCADDDDDADHPKPVPTGLWSCPICAHPCRIYDTWNVALTVVKLPTVLRGTAAKNDAHQREDSHNARSLRVMSEDQICRTPYASTRPVGPTCSCGRRSRSAIPDLARRVYATRPSASITWTSIYAVASTPGRFRAGSAPRRRAWSKWLVLTSRK